MSGIDVALPTSGPFDEGFWIAADARIDDRDTLYPALGVAPTAELSDSELIARAFATWGERCVDHLLGDFAFAIWNGHARRLFCARDHLGVKPLHYVDRNGWVLVSSGVDRLRQHPAVSGTLDDLAVADFLLFGHKTDPAATTFLDIRRVPPAHTLTWSPESGCHVVPYWELPVDEPAYRKDAEYAAMLRERLDRAVADRMRGGRVSVFFSGGLDSTIVAARARRHAGPSGREAVRACSFLHEPLLADDEREYAAAAATHLGIRCDFYETGGATIRRRFEAANTPEPLAYSIEPAVLSRCLHDAATHGRIAFTGEGADNALLYEWASYLRYLWNGGRLRRLVIDGAKYAIHHRRVPLWSMWTRDRAVVVDAAAGTPIPPWMSRDLVQRLRLEDRWRYVMREATSRHPVRPAAYFSLQLPLWQDMFDTWHPAYTGVALDVRHPFLDLRVLRFLLTVPVIPWCREKHLLRYAFADDLPPLVRRRRKTPLRGSLAHASIARDGLPPILGSSRLGAYITDSSRVSTRTPAEAESAMRLVTFSHWLGRQASIHAGAAQG